MHRGQRGSRKYLAGGGFRPFGVGDQSEGRRTLGIELKPALAAQADRVIE